VQRIPLLVCFPHSFIHNSSAKCHLGHSDRAAPEGKQTSRKTRFWHPLKRAWRKASSKIKDEQSVHTQTSHGSQTPVDRKRLRRCPHVTIAVQEDEPRSSTGSKPEASPREPGRNLPKSSETSLVVRPPSPTSTPVVATVGIDSNVDQAIDEINPWVDQESSHTEPAQSTTLLDAIAPAKSLQEDDLASTGSRLDDVTVEVFPSPPIRSSQAQNDIEDKSFDDEQDLPVLSRLIFSEHERSKTLPSRFSISDYQQSLASSFTYGDSTPSTIKIRTASERAEYDRIVKVFYRQQACRIPIPITWRSSAPRAYLFRSPSSPYRNMVTSPSAPRGKDVLPVIPRFATEPRRATASSCATASSRDAALALHDIATRRVMRFPAARPNASELEIDSDNESLGSPSNPAELPDSEISSPPTRRKHPGRRISSGLYVLRGSVEEGTAEEEPRKRIRRTNMDQLSFTAIPRGSSGGSAIPIASAPRLVSLPTLSEFPKTVPQIRPTRPVLEVPSAMAGARSRVSHTIGDPTRVRFLEPVTLDEESVISVAEGSSVPVQSTEYAEVSRRAAAIIARARAQVQVQAQMRAQVQVQARTDQDCSVLSADDEIWYHASNVAVVDDQMH
jgi:hypothetical protein